MNIKSLLVVSFLLVHSLAWAQTVVLPYQPGVTTEGVTYYLPKTRLNILVQASCTTQHPGELHSYASRFLRLTDVTNKKQIKWNIDKITVIPQGIPDTTKVFSIPLKKATIAPLVSLSSDGLILSINTAAEEEHMPDMSPQESHKSNQLNSKDYLSQEILYAGSVAKMAELTANEIYELRESRTALSKGESDNLPKDGEQLKLMIQQLSLQEEALLQLFKGYQEDMNKTFHLSFLPEKNIKKDILFRFSDQSGVVSVNDLSGEPIYIDITDCKTLPSEVFDGKKKKTEEQAVRYNITSEVSVKIYSRNKVYCELTTPLPQFGRTEVLSNELFNKRQSTQVLFNQQTGTLKKITDESIDK